MTLPIRTFAFVALTAAAWGADVRYRDAVLAPQAAAAAVGQVNGDGAAALRGVQARGGLVDDAAVAGTVVAAVVCFANWRPRPRVVHIDRRGDVTGA